MTLLQLKDHPSFPRRSPSTGSSTLPPVRLLTFVVGLAGFIALVSLLYAVSLHAVVGDSDGATVLLEGQSMASGHLTLSGWALSLDSFWAVDALFYMVVELVTGTRDVLLYFVPALIAALVVVVGAYLARDGRRGPAGAVAAITVVALLGLPSHVLSLFFLRGPLHVGTALWCLLAFAGLRSGRLGWGWIAAVGFFAAGTLGDLQMVALGIAPAVIAGLIAMLRSRSWRTGLPTVSAAVVGLIVAEVVRRLAMVVGTFAIATSHPTASAPQTLTNLGRVATWGADMLGVGNGGFSTGGVPDAFQAFHVLGLVAVIAGVVMGTLSLVRGAVRGRSAPPTPTSAWRLDDLLVIAFFADLVVFVVLTSSNDTGFMRYLTAAVIFGSILAGRLMGRLAATLKPRWLLRIGGAIGLAATTAFAVGLGFGVTTPAPSRTFDTLGQFLEAHQLDHGIGDYWSASITTVATQGSVMLRPVITTPQGKVVRYQRQSDASWYSGQSFEFLVYNTARPWGGIDSDTASATFGPVDHTYVVGSYRVLVWNHPVSVSSTGFSPVAQLSMGHQSPPPASSPSKLRAARGGPPRA
jgi:hypothetical protein